MDFLDREFLLTSLTEKTEVFTLEEFHKFLKGNSVKISKNELLSFLHSSDNVFPLVDNKYVTRAGAFTGRWFSFKPSKEEVEKNCFILGHRCMPFVNPEISPDNITVVKDGKEVPPKSESFSMNLALDTFGLFGEGFVLPYVINDKSNSSVTIASVQQVMPTEITLTCWSITDVLGDVDFKYGDRIVCRVADWKLDEVEMFYLQNELNDMVISESAIQREQWYADFEKGLINGFDRHGPSASIEQQLAFLFLENQEQLCIQSCGSCEEFMVHTNKIGLVQYGVESRIWHSKKAITFAGPWNESEEDLIIAEMTMLFVPQVIDAYLENNIYEEESEKKAEDMNSVMDKLFPKALYFSETERKSLLLNIEKRRAILKKNYNRFSDYQIAAIRKRALDIFTQVSALLCAIGCSGIKTDDFPQQELIVMIQLYGHLIRLLEELENVFLRSAFPVDDVSLSLDGMVETYEDIRGTLKNCLERNRYKGFGIVKGDE